MPLMVRCRSGLGRERSQDDEHGEAQAMSGGWGCPHEVGGRCQRVRNRPCDPGMKGCVLYGRFTFSDPAKNRPAGAGRSRVRNKRGK